MLKSKFAYWDGTSEKESDLLVLVNKIRNRVDVQVKFWSAMAVNGDMDSICNLVTVFREILEVDQYMELNGESSGVTDLQVLKTMVAIFKIIGQTQENYQTEADLVAVYGGEVLNLQDEQKLGLYLNLEREMVRNSATISLGIAALLNGADEKYIACFTNETDAKMLAAKNKKR